MSDSEHQLLNPSPATMNVYLKLAGLPPSAISSAVVFNLAHEGLPISMKDLKVSYKSLIHISLNSV